MQRLKFIIQFHRVSLQLDLIFTEGLLHTKNVEKLAVSGGFVGLSEVMNVGGAWLGKKEVMLKLAIANRLGLP